MKFRQNDMMMDQLFTFQQQPARPKTGKALNRSNFIHKNTTQQNLRVVRERRAKADQSIQGERTRLLIQQSKNLANFDRIKRLALFDNQDFIQDPLGSYYRPQQPRDWTTFEKFENLQHNFAKSYINRQYQLQANEELLEQLELM